MFGYIKPDYNELKVKDVYEYKKLYCGLCYYLRKDYGSLAGCLLSYDVTFLLLVLNEIEQDKIKVSFRCPINPHKKICIELSSKAAHFSAFINYYMVKMKLDDDISDDKTLWKKLVVKILSGNRKYKNASERFDQAKIILEYALAKVYRMEKEPLSFDEITNQFGLFFRDVLCLFFLIESPDRYVVSQPFLRLFHDLGKWIYLVDALDDYYNDKKQGKFNLLSTMTFQNIPDYDELVKRVNRISNLLVYKMKKQLDGLDFPRIEIIRNIVSYGCSFQLKKVEEKQLKT